MKWRAYDMVAEGISLLSSKQKWILRAFCAKWYSSVIDSIE